MGVEDQISVQQIYPIPDIIQTGSFFYSKRIKENKPGAAYTWKHLKKNSELVFVEIKASNLLYNNRKTRLVMITDVTAKVKAEASLHKTNEQYRLANERFYFATQATSDIIWDWDIKNETIEWTENFHKILGHSLPVDSTLPVNYHMDNLHPKDKSIVIQSLNKAIDNTQKKNGNASSAIKKEMEVMPVLRTGAILFVMIMVKPCA